MHKNGMTTTGGTSIARALLEECRSIGDLTERLEAFSSRFLGLPYINNPLGGGPGCQESLVIRFDGYDCVTFIETVLALARSRTESEFVTALRQMRYEGGNLAWHNRNHYMTDWIRKNQDRGLVRDITRGTDAVEKMRRLSLIKDLSPKEVTFQVIPKLKLARLRSMVATGDLLLFASTRPNLDVFHLGMAIRRAGDAVVLRHASRSAMRVIDQPIQDFLKAHRMSGIILVRPLCPKTSPVLKPR